MTRDEQFVVILLGALLMAQRAAKVIDATRIGANRHSPAQQSVNGYAATPASRSTNKIDLVV